MGRSRDYRAEYRRRQERARLLGFTSYGQQRRAPRRLRRMSDFGRLPDAARESRTDALSVVRVARRDRIPIEDAAVQLGVSVEAVRWWAPDALTPSSGGRTFAKRGDRILRLRPVIVEGDSEVSFVTVRGSGAALGAEEAFDVQWRFITGQASEAELASIQGVRIGGQTVEADPDRLEAIAAAGGVDVPETYRGIL